MLYEKLLTIDKLNTNEAKNYHIVKNPNSTEVILTK